MIRKTILTRLDGLPESYEIDNWGDYYGWLEISRVTNKFFEINVIPHTLDLTNLKNLKINDLVNVELDIFSKYIYKYSS